MGNVRGFQEGGKKFKSKFKSKKGVFPHPLHKPLPWIKKTEQSCVPKGKSQIVTVCILGEFKSRSS